MRNLFLALAIFPAFASASIDNNEVATCAAEPNTVGRLSCYDSLAARHDLAPKSEITKVQDTGKWITRTSTDPLNDKAVHSTVLVADSGAGRFGEEIMMAVRCQDNRTEMYVDWNSFLGGDGIATTYRVGKATAISSTWSLSTDKQAAFFPGTPIPVLKQMTGETSFVVNVTPYNSNPITAIFDITGAENAFTDIREGCNW